MSMVDKVRECLADGQPRTLQEIADKVGITRQGVWWVCKRYNLSWIPRGRSSHRPHCKKCGKPIRYGKRKTGICQKCRRGEPIPLTCSGCGRVFYTARPSDAKQRIRRNKKGLFFCNNHCKGVYLGREYGYKSTKGG